MSSSKQTNFFIVPEDLPLISVFLKENEVVLTKKPIQDINDLLSSDIDLTNSDLSYQVYLTKKEYQNKILLKQQKTGYEIDIVKSYIIEFDLGGFYPYSDKILHRARFYAVTGYYEDGHQVKKRITIL